MIFWLLKMKIVLDLYDNKSKAYLFHADMVELVDMLDLGSSAARRVGSTPSIRTKAYSKE